MIVERKISVNVRKCPQCPWFSYHPQEPSCQLKRSLDNIYPEYKGYGDIVGHWNIAEDCPIKLGRYPHCSK